MKRTILKTDKSGKGKIKQKNKHLEQNKSENEHLKKDNSEKEISEKGQF